MNPDYYNWLFHTVGFADEFYRWGHGIVDDLWTTGWQEMKNISIPVPPLDEQEKIARFLDEKCAEIDALMARISDEIDLFKEKKVSIIMQTVWKGLNSDSSLKHSGVPWIGTIPSCWDLVPVKYLCEEVSEKNDIGKITNALKFTYGSIVQKTNFDAENDEYVADTILTYTIIRPGDIVINCLNLNYDFVSQRVGINSQVGVITSAYLAIRVKDLARLNPFYANYALKAYDGAKAFHNMGKGVRKTLGFDELGRQLLPLPSLKEQEQIVNYLNRQCELIDGAIEIKDKQLKTLDSYKKSIIYEYVTGKKEVAQ